MSSEVVPGTDMPPSPSADAEPDHSVQVALLAAITESSDDAIVVKTLEDRILSWNAGAQRIFSYGPDEVIGQSISRIIPPALHDEEQRILQQLRRGERIDHFATVRVTKDGRCIPISLTLSPVRDSRGRIISVVEIARDISERTRTEEALRQNDQALREADRRKNHFLALLGHELRNPLAPIRYALASWRKPETTPEQRKHAEEIFERQLTQMSHLLDELLDLARLTRETLELKRSAVELSSIVEIAVETARPFLEAKQQTLQLELPQSKPRLQADAVRLAQVFSNLLINAAKYTDPHGQIRCRAAQEGREVIFSVRDNGIGIAPEMLPRVFDLFTQADDALERAQGGLGIGLALVRGLVGIHGGTVEAHSAGIGHGSEFVVRLPLLESSGRVAAQPPPAGGAPTRSTLKILVVDDNADAADGCALFLSLQGHQVQTAYDGHRALELGESFRPEVMLLDIGLPDINGYQLAQTVRASDWGVTIVLIAVTGWGQQKDRQRAFDAGFDHHFTKPLAPEQIEMLLQSCPPPSRRPVRPHTHSHSGTFLP